MGPIEIIMGKPTVRVVFTPTFDRMPPSGGEAVTLVFIPALWTKRTLPLSRATECITIATASNIRVATNAAEAMGLPLTHFVTITFALTACGTEKGVRAFAKLRNAYFNKWVARKRVKASWTPTQPAHIWVFENPDDFLHTHWAVHIPAGAEAEFMRKLYRWLEIVTGGPLGEGALDVRPVDDASRLALYMLKGADERYTQYSRIRHEPQGTMQERRCGVSRALNRTARKEAGINGQRMRGKNRAFWRAGHAHSATPTHSL